jgi:hypothetical protein
MSKEEQQVLAEVGELGPLLFFRVRITACHQTLLIGTFSE